MPQKVEDTPAPEKVNAGLSSVTPAIWKPPPKVKKLCLDAKESDEDGDAITSVEGDLHPDALVIVQLQYEGKKSRTDFKYFVAKILTVDGSDKITCSFMRRVIGHFTFIFLPLKMKWKLIESKLFT